MPIRREWRHFYGREWRTEIRPRILLRAAKRCEFCGVADRAMGTRDGRGTFHALTPAELDASTAEGELRGRRVIRIVLTIAHIDHNPSNNADTNLKALCQRCHLRHDRAQHVENRRETVWRNKAAAVEKSKQRRFFNPYR